MNRSAFSSASREELDDPPIDAELHLLLSPTDGNCLLSVSVFVLSLLSVVVLAESVPSEEPDFGESIEDSVLTPSVLPCSELDTGLLSGAFLPSASCAFLLSELLSGLALVTMGSAGRRQISRSEGVVTVRLNDDAELVREVVGVSRFTDVLLEEISQCDDADDTLALSLMVTGEEEEASWEELL